MGEASRSPMFKERFKILYQASGCKTITDFAKELGLSRQTTTYYLNGERIPDIETLWTICKKCNVSADYLLGLSDEPDMSQTVQSVCKYTGLSSDTVNFLHRRHYEKDHFSFYKKLFHSLIQIGQDNFDNVPELIVEAGRAKIIAKSEKGDTKRDFHNMLSVVTRTNRAYQISAAEAEEYFLDHASAEICQAIANVIGELENDVIKKMENSSVDDDLSLEDIDFWSTIIDEMEDNPEVEGEDNG